MPGDEQHGPAAQQDGTGREQARRHDGRRPQAPRERPTGLPGPPEVPAGARIQEDMPHRGSARGPQAGQFAGAAPVSPGPGSAWPSPPPAPARPARSWAAGEPNAAGPRATAPGGLASAAKARGTRATAHFRSWLPGSSAASTARPAHHSPGSRPGADASRPGDPRSGSRHPWHGQARRARQPSRTSAAPPGSPIAATPVPTVPGRAAARRQVTNLAAHRAAQLQVSGRATVTGTHKSNADTQGLLPAPRRPTAVSAVGYSQPCRCPRRRSSSPSRRARPPVRR